MRCKATAQGERIHEASAKKPQLVVRVRGVEPERLVKHISTGPKRRQLLDGRLPGTLALGRAG